MLRIYIIFLFPSNIHALGSPNSVATVILEILVIGLAAFIIKVSVFKVENGILIYESGSGEQSLYLTIHYEEKTKLLLNDVPS